MRRFSDHERELPAALDHAADGAAELTNRIEETHQAIARRIFKLTPSTPARVAHDAISRTVYHSVRLSLRALLGAGAAVARRAPAVAEPTRGHRGSIAQAAVNGIVGDRLARENSPLTVHMAVRAGGRDVPVIPSALAAAFPRAGDHPVLLLHGLCEQDDAWSIGAGRRDGTYGSRVIGPGGGTAVTLRYNSGLRLADNGRSLAELIERIVAAWPVPVRRLSLIGHSMGGIVARSAVAHGRADQMDWTTLLHTVVTLGSPHAGAPGARAADIASRACERIPELRPVATVLRTRSIGIVGLESGAFALPGTGTGSGDRPHGPAVHHAVSATLSAGPRHPFGRLLGDLLVTPASAHGLRRGVEVAGFAADGLHHLGRANHFTLLNTPRLDAALSAWLFGARPTLEAA